jgi:hypothetical protein
MVGLVGGADGLEDGDGLLVGLGDWVGLLEGDGLGGGVGDSETVLCGARDRCRCRVRAWPGAGLVAGGPLDPMMRTVLCAGTRPAGRIVMTSPAEVV